MPPPPVTLIFDLLILKVMFESRADFSLPRHLCSRLRPDVRDRQTVRRQTDRCQTASSLPCYAPLGGA